MVGSLIDNLHDMKQTNKSIVLYSGGLDSTYFLHWAVQNNLDVIALHINLESSSPKSDIAKKAQLLGVEYLYINAVDEFVDDFITQGIKVNCLYQNVFPICSSLSRPLMAKKAVDIARQYQADCIVHTSCYHQNSASRFNLSIRTLAPELNIGNPFLKENICRETKLRELKKLSLLDEKNIFSVDQNVWGRVIENGSLDNLQYFVPEEAFSWTNSPYDSPQKNQTISLTFESGLPVAINGENKTLLQIIEELNFIGNLYGVGRFNGLEDIPLGQIKNHEVREAPGAKAILSSFQALATANLTQRELRVKTSLDYEWTELVVGGHWYSPLKKAIDEFIREICIYISGRVVLTYSPGNVFISAIDSPKSLDLHSLERQITENFSSFSYGDFFEISTSHILKRG